MTKKETKVGIIGGTGLYDLQGIEIIGEERIDTPFGAPSDVLIRAQIAGMEVIFLPRHGKGHKFLPHEVNYRANIYALKSLGVTWCISVSACGSLRENIHPGDIAIVDQLIDRTSGRESSFFGDGVIAHVSMADPFCPILRKALIQAVETESSSAGFKIHSSGTYVCISGPQFSTRAESHMYRAWGADIIGMTNLPEAKLAREAEIAYATMALVTDFDCWKNDGEDVDAVNVIEVLKKNSENAKKVLLRIIPELAKLEPAEFVSKALDSAVFTDLSKAPEETVKKLGPVLARVLSR